MLWRPRSPNPYVLPWFGGSMAFASGCRNGRPLERSFTDLNPSRHSSRSFHDPCLSFALTFFKKTQRNQNKPKENFDAQSYWRLSKKYRTAQLPQAVPTARGSPRPRGPQGPRVPRPKGPQGQRNGSPGPKGPQGTGVPKAQGPQGPRVLQAHGPWAMGRYHPAIPWDPSSVETKMFGLARPGQNTNFSWALVVGNLEGLMVASSLNKEATMKPPVIAP